VAAAAIAEMTSTTRLQVARELEARAVRQLIDSIREVEMLVGPAIAGMVAAALIIALSDEAERLGTAARQAET
jgi:hypothetical protein